MRAVYFSVALLVFACTCLMASELSYTVSSIGTVDCYEALDINDSGLVIGSFYANDGSHTFIWESTSGETNIGINGHNGDYGIGINNHGVALGFEDPYNGHPYVWNAIDGKTTIALPSGSIGCSPRAINDNGQFTGDIVDGSNNSYAVLWSQNGQVTPLGTLGGRYSQARGINSAGQVVGSSDAVEGQGGHAFVWSSVDGMKDLDPDGWCSYAYSINNKGQVVGNYSDVGDYGAFIWSPETGMKKLGVIFGSYCWGIDINNNGRMIGTAQFPDGNGVTVRSYVWESSTGAVALPLLAGYNQCAVYAINNNGQIVGRAYDDRGNSQAVIWNPVPEPSSFMALGAGIAALTTLKRRRNR